MARTVGKDYNTPPSTDYLGCRLNENGSFSGGFEYKNGKWVVTNCKEIEEYNKESGSQGIIDSLINGAPEELDTLGEIANALSSKEDKTSGKGLSTNDYTDEDKEKVEKAYIKPSDGIPASDLASGVIPDVSGKENTSNKVTSLSSESTNTQYPSAKCVYDALSTVNPERIVSMDFGINETVIDGISAYDSITINKVVASNCATIKISYGNVTQQTVTSDTVDFTVLAGEPVVGEITRTDVNSNALVGFKFDIN